jgi:hypothetical protein
MNNYHLPEQCCLKCKHSTVNTYDDTICQVVNEVIERGGVCDLFEFDSPTIEVIPQQQTIQIEEEVEYTCEDCSCNVNGRCAVDGTSAVHICTAFSNRSVEVSVYTDDIDIDTGYKPCETCVHAYYNNGVPWCKELHKQIDASDTCEMHEEEISNENSEGSY